MRRKREVEARGNYISEWFGHRVFPIVSSTPEALADQQAHRCPFLSAATGESRECIKTQAALGTCTINSSSNGQRQDWLICPYRALDRNLLEQVTRRLYRVEPNHRVFIAPAPTMARAADRKQLLGALRAGDTCLLYVQDKLGGEISISATERSPELSFDVTLVQVLESADGVTLGRYGIFEGQTMDFHGSYRAVVDNLKHALRLHGDRFHETVAANQGWLSERIEGPNIANVFKRTFYQMVLKFQIAADETCAGCALAIPAAVWDSWQRHLGKPELVDRGDGVSALQFGTAEGRTPAWIYVFDLDSTSSLSPNPIVMTRVIATDADSIVHYALKVAPEAAVAGVGQADRVIRSIRQRVGKWWPELGNIKRQRSKK